MAIGSVNGTPQGLSPKKYIWQQTPTVVQNYLTEVNYENVPYDVTYITSYAQPEQEFASPNTKPIGQSVDLSTGTLVQNGYKISVDAGANVLYNAVPNTQTAYSLIDNNDKTKQTGVLAPTGALRWIKCITPNVRDLGGWNCDNGTIKYDMLFRGGDAESQDKDIMVNQIGIRHELNLRGDEGPQTATSPWGVKFTRLSGYVWYDLTKIDLWRQLLRCVFDSVRYSEPLYFHCSAGTDRTGTLAVILEGLLGVSQGDIDKDYELSAFFYGTATNSPPLRTDPEYVSLINAINNIVLPSGVPNSFRNKVIYFVASLGFTADEINAFRTAMIDGTPEQINLVLNSYSVTKTVPPEITFDNAADTISQYQPYIATITAPSNAVFDITITMGGVDAKQYFSGQIYCPQSLTHNVTTNLINCTSNNAATAVIENESYACEIAADAGYSLEDTNITITMGGVDAKQYFILHN